MNYYDSLLRYFYVYDIIFVLEFTTGSTMSFPG